MKNTISSKVNGEWVTQHVELTREEVAEVEAKELAWAQGAADRIREIRNEALAATDYIGLADYPAKAGEMEYRQSLRDVPQQAGFPKTHTWPNKP